MSLSDSTDKPGADYYVFIFLIQVRPEPRTSVFELMS